MPQQFNLGGGLIATQGLLQFDFKPTLALSARRFDDLDLAIRSYREPLKRSIQQVIAPSIGQNFISNGRPDSWTPLADDTIRVKSQDPNARYGVDSILRRSGLLWKTMQQYNIWTVTSTQAAILSLPEKIWYGNIHQAGFGMHASQLANPFHTTPEALASMGGAAKIYIPARPFAMLQTEDLDKIQEVFSVWLNERIIATLGL